MLKIKTRWLIPGLIFAAGSVLSACGSGSRDDGDGRAIELQDTTAVSANAAEFPASTGASGKIEPVVRSGAQAPLDSMPETPVSAGPIPAHDGVRPPTSATKMFANGFEGGIALIEPTGEDASVSEPQAASIKSVASREGGITNALSLQSKEQGGDGEQESVEQSAQMNDEMVVYQRMWLKFDADTLRRAQAAGSADFSQVFWGATARPDYRIRLMVRYDDSIGLYWHAAADLLNGGSPAWTADLKENPVVQAPPTAAAGWHKAEIWIDRPNGRFKAAIDGNVLVDRSGNLFGNSANRIDEFKMMMASGPAAPRAEVLFDDLELWDAPPADAWTK